MISNQLAGEIGEYTGIIVYWLLFFGAVYVLRGSYRKGKFYWSNAILGGFCTFIFIAGWLLKFGLISL